MHDGPYYDYENPEEYRTYHYWRGFRAAIIIISPLIALLMISAYVLIAAMTR